MLDYVMCGRFGLSATQEDINERFGINLEDPLLVSRQQIAPSQKAIVLIFKENKLKAITATWGIKLSQANQRSSLLINTRVESLGIKPFYKFSKAKRVLVPATHFYEWMEYSGTKVPIVFRHKIDKIMALGGILFEVSSTDGTTSELRFTIVTVPSSGPVSYVHDRMPLIIEKQDEEVWLNSDTQINTIRSIATHFPSSNVKSDANI
jgi:putative SOS response-associated peptidase YedK